MAESALMLSLRGLSRSYGATKALEGLSLDLKPGEILALCGENGAGKSTMIRLLCGAEKPDQGSMTLSGKLFRPGDPAEARSRGLSTLHQELSLCPNLSVEENILLGREPSRGLLLDRGEGRRKALEALERCGCTDLDPGRKVGPLSLGLKQRVELARALAWDCTLLLLDEPTARLSQGEAEALFVLLKDLRDRGLMILYVSHFLDEVSRLADRVLVLRDGKLAGELGPPLDPKDILTLMTGAPASEIYPPRRPRLEGPVLLEAREIRGRILPRRATVSIRSGEILGLAGLTGSGRTELLRCLYGLDPMVSGHLRLEGMEAIPGPTGRIAQGLGLLSEDRKGEGLALGLSVAANITLSSLADLAPRGWISPVREDLLAGSAAEGLELRAAGLDIPAGKLSGGNQQKAAFARLKRQGARVLLLDQPTRGVDMASRSRIYHWIDGWVRSGGAALIASDDPLELLGLCDRVAVMNEGRLGEFLSVERWDQARLLASIAAAPRRAA